MGISLDPSVNLVRCTIKKYSLAPPIDIEKLVNKYADLVYAEIPFEGVDGISLNLKVRGKKPRVIVNTNPHPLRQRFTMAHELGHILIPWHFGTIIDNASPCASKDSNEYWERETEANAFAAELLMPYQWVMKLLADTKNLAKLHGTISQRCKTSLQSAGIRLAQILPENIVYASEHEGVVEFSGKTQGTIASPLNWNEQYPQNPFYYSKRHHTSTYNGRQLHWWNLPSEIHIDTSDDRHWSKILDCIIQDLGIPTAKIIKFEQSINGVIGYANSACRREGNYNVDSIVSACIQRFNNNPMFEALVQHNKFEAFLAKKAEDLANRSR